MSKRRKKKSKQGPEAEKVTARMTTRDIPREANDISELAERFEGRVVGQWPLVFFATETRDAWMLDMEDSLALPLVREGRRLPTDILGSRSQARIEWTHDFEIEGHVMFFSDRQGHLEAVEGYPVREIIEIGRPSPPPGLPTE
jgi:hypothetical protein